MTPIRTAEGEVTNFLWVREDITARKKAEEELHRSEANYRAAQEKFRQLFEQNEEPLFLFRQGTSEVLDANPAAARLYGYDRQELRRHGLSLFVPPPELDGFRSAIAAVRPGAGLTLECARHRRKDGARIEVSVRANSVRTEEEEMVYGSFRDITARIRMEEEAKLQQAQLIHANRMASLGTIVSGVAHEVNNPNNLVMFNAPMILSAWEDAVPVLDAYSPGERRIFPGGASLLRDAGGGAETGGGDLRRLRADQGDRVEPEGFRAAGHLPTTRLPSGSTTSSAWRSPSSTTRSSAPRTASRWRTGRISPR